MQWFATRSTQTCDREPITHIFRSINETSMARSLDVLFINADAPAKVYQELAKDYAAIEPPTWSLLLAESCRSKGYGVAILDATAERLTDEQTVRRIADMHPRLACFVVYGQNP